MFFLFLAKTKTGEGVKIQQRIALAGGLSLLGAALAMAVTGQDDDAAAGVVGAVQKPAPVSQAAQPQKRFDLAAIKRGMPEPEQQGTLFRSKSWYVAPPPPPVSVAPAPAPTAPPLPFTYIGRMVDEGVVVVFLSGNGRQYTVKAGDVLDNTYRVETIGDNDAVLTYLPLDIKQTLTFKSGLAGRSSAASTFAPLPLIQVSAQT